MGIFSWLFRRKQPPENPMVGGPDDDTPVVIVKRDDGGADVMDREFYEFKQGLREGETPANSPLSDLLARAERVRVFYGAMYRGQPTTNGVLLETEDPSAVETLREALVINEDADTFGHCACLGGPTLEISAGDEPLATLGIHHGTSVRWTRWSHDAQLLDGPKLTSWLVENGIDAEFLEEHYQTNHLFSG